MKSGGNAIHDFLDALDPEVREMLREDLPSQYRSVTEALSRSDWACARGFVHTINGSASFCRIEPLRAAAETLELQLSDPPPQSSIRDRFERAIEDVIAALENESNNQQHRN